MRRALLIDGDMVIYRIAAALEMRVEWPDGAITTHSNLNLAMHLLRGALANMELSLNASKLIVALKGPGTNWRNGIMPEYKANRKNKERPSIYTPLKDMVEEAYTTLTYPGLEGDDVLGILATDPFMVLGEKIVVSGDKDMMTIPGKHIDYNKVSKTCPKNYDDYVIDVSEDSANHAHMLQTLTGDPSDGYRGCPGIGVSRAERILEQCRSPQERWEAVVETYRYAHLTPEDALKYAQVARILQHTDYDIPTSTVKPWQPPSSE